MMLGAPPYPISFNNGYAIWMITFNRIIPLSKGRICSTSFNSWSFFPVFPVYPFFIVSHLLPLIHYSINVSRLMRPHFSDNLTSLFKTIEHMLINFMVFFVVIGNAENVDHYFTIFEFEISEIHLFCNLIQDQKNH